MTQETFIIGGREFTAARMMPFAANKLLMRLQKVAFPVFGALVGAGKGLGDVDVRDAAKVISEHIDESLFDSIVFPMFAESRVFCADNKRFIKTPADIDVTFTTQTLFDLYELIFVVGRYQFAPFFSTLADRFGGILGGENPLKSPENLMKT